MDYLSFFNKKTILGVFPIKLQNKEEEEEEFGGDKLKEKTKEKNSKVIEMREIFEQNLNNNIKIKGACTIDKIKNILSRIKIDKNIIDKIDGNFITNKDKESVSLFETKVKQERNKNSKKEIKLGKKTDRKMGRKNKDDATKGKHDKNSPDNIIKKCKRIFFENAIIYINSAITKFGSYQQNDFVFKKLDYKKNVDSLKKDEEMKLFNMQLKDFISLEISSKYSSTSDKKINKKKMKKLLEDEKDNPKLNYLLNMKFGEWIDVFTFQTEINFSSKFNGLENILNTLYKKEKDKYFSRFIFYLFNYKNWFQNKKGRKPKITKSNK